MKKNVIIFLIDGLRADQCIWRMIELVKHQILTSLIQKGMYFEQAASSADGTIISLNTIFSIEFSSCSYAVKYQKIVLNENNLIEYFKKKWLSCLWNFIPNTYFLQFITRMF